MKERLGYKLNFTARVYARRLNEMFTATGMYSSQWPVVLLLSERGPCTQVELTEQLAVEPPTMTRTLSRMEKAGWIRRVPGRDRRERRVELTEQSVRMIDEWKAQSRELEQQALQQVSAEDYAAFDRVMKRIRSNLRVED